MALRHRKESEAHQLKGVILSADEKKLELGRFTKLQNWIPAGIYSLKKKRGVLPLGDNQANEQNLIFQPNSENCTNPGDCVADTTTGIMTVTNGCGFFVAPCVPHQAIYLGVGEVGAVYAQAKFKGNVTSSALSGPALSVAAGSTRGSYTGYVAAYSGAGHSITLYRYNAAAISGAGTALGSYSVTLATNDVVKIEKTIQDVVTVYVNGTSRISIVDTVIDYNNTGFGLVGIGSGGTAHQDWSNFEGGCIERVISTDPCCVSSPLLLAACSNATEITCPAGLLQENVDSLHGNLVLIEACGGTAPYTFGVSTNGFLRPTDRADQFWVGYKDPTVTYVQETGSISIGVVIDNTTGGRYPGYAVTGCEGAINAFSGEGVLAVQHADGTWHYDDGFLVPGDAPCEPGGAYITSTSDSGLRITYHFFCNGTEIAQIGGTDFGVLVSNTPMDEHGWGGAWYYKDIGFGGDYTGTGNCAYEPCQSIPDTVSVMVTDDNGDSTSIDILVVPQET
jgi:hypothetical protein